MPTSSGSVTVSCQAATTSLPTILTWSLGDLGLLPGNKLTVSPAFHLETSATSGSQVAQFAGPWTLTEVASGRLVHPASLVLCTWNEATGSWDTLPAEVDTEAVSASAALDHLSQFVLLAEQPKNLIWQPTVLRKQ